MMGRLITKVGQKSCPDVRDYDFTAHDFDLLRQK